MAGAADEEAAPLPRYHFRATMPSLWEMARRGVSDTASVIPDAVLDEPAVQLPGPGAPLIVTDPGLVREVLNDRAEFFVRDRFMRRLLRRAWGKGLAAAEGPHWRAQRQAAAPAFRPQAVATNSAAFAAAAGRAAVTWPMGDSADLPVLAARIIADIVFTTLVDGQGEVDTAAVAADMPAYIRRIAGFGFRDLLPLPETWHDRLSGISGDPAVQRVHALAHRLATARERRGERQDIVALLDGVGPVEDNIRGLFPAAMDTTVSGASWTLYTLARRPDWQARVAEEGRACLDGDWTADRLPLTRRVVQEVLRLYPPAPMLVRTAANAGKLGAFALRKGQPVSLLLYAMHRHRTLWDRPDTFDPDRFLPEHGPHVGWLPFGFGPRVCIAAQFAQMEIAVVVARLLAELALEPTAPEPQVTLQVTTRSATGLRVTAKPR